MDKITPYTVDNFIQLSGPLFTAVQRSGVLGDSKTFVDSIPVTPPKEIESLFLKYRNDPGFDLKAFIHNHFKLPKSPQSNFASTGDMVDHIDRLWDYLIRKPDQETSEHSTLIPLPHPYIVPGGRFREIYYWDTYFTAEGLAASGRVDLVKNMIRNFVHLIEKIGHVPNGNRYYYVSRSQPPFLALMIDLIAKEENLPAIQEFIPALQQEYEFWMQGAESLDNNQAHRRVVNIEGATLNRYWDDRPLPREESWREDTELAKGLDPEQATQRYRDLRAGAESGWDFSSRWLADKKSLQSIETTNIVPVDLNALLYFMEVKLSEWSNDRTQKNNYAEAAEQRKRTFDRFFWNASEGFYFDYNWKKNTQTDIWSLAGAYPLFLGLASDQQAEKVARHLEQQFLKDGGLVSTLHETGQQWDYPNGWAPLQWIAVKGLFKYDYSDLAQTIAGRWLDLNKAVFQRTGKMMEKYNVCDLSLEAGGGEYPLQDGFGWTNGVAVALRELLDRK